jgi:hypothetical protein
MTLGAEQTRHQLTPASAARRALLVPSVFAHQMMAEKSKHVHDHF